jgi:hypothetical protein
MKSTKTKVFSSSLFFQPNAMKNSNSSYHNPEILNFSIAPSRKEMHFISRISTYRSPIDSIP